MQKQIRDQGRARGEAAGPELDDLEALWRCPNDLQETKRGDTPSGRVVVMHGHGRCKLPVQLFLPGPGDGHDSAPGRGGKPSGDQLDEAGWGEHVRSRAVEAWRDAARPGTTTPVRVS